MSKLILLWLVLFLGIVWLAFPYDPNPDNWISFFKFSDQRLPWQNYVFHLCEKFIFVVLAWIIYNDSTVFKTALFVFFIIQVIKLVDYLLTYNEVWVRPFERVPFSSNTLGILLFSLAVSYEFIWDKEKKPN